MPSTTPVFSHNINTLGINELTDLPPTKGDETNGLEDVVDWDLLEEPLLAGEFISKAKFRQAVLEQFEAHGEVLNQDKYKQVLAGLFPEARAAYGSLRKYVRPARTEKKVA